MSPTSKQYDIAAGEHREDHVTVINDGNTAYDVVMYARPYSVKNEAYEPDFATVSPRSDVYKWIQFTETEFRLEPGERKDVAYNLRVPDTAAPGGHYGVIFAETQPSDAPEGVAIERKKRVGSLIYARIDGDIIQKGDIVDTTLLFWQKEPPLAAVARVENAGNVDFVVATNVVVKDIFGRTVHADDGDYRVLPETTRAISLAWEASPHLGLFFVEADIEVPVLDKDETFSGYVLLMPVWLPMILSILIIMGVAYGVVRYTYKHKKRRRR